VKADTRPNFKKIWNHNIEPQIRESQKLFALISPCLAVSFCG